MFWGLIMEPQKRYSQTVKRSFHISMAALDICSCSDEPVQVMCGFENRKYLLCTLQREGLLQCSLDLNFDVGDQVSFVTNGSSHVHLSGYINEDYGMDGMEEGEEEEEEADVLENISTSNIIAHGKRPKKPTSQDTLPPAKKSKLMQMLDDVNSQDESDDSDVELSDIIDEEDDETTFAEEDEDDDEDGAEEEEDDGEEAEEEEDDDNDEEEDDSSEEEEEVKPKMNGIAKKKQAVPDKKKVEEAKPKTKADKKKEAAAAKNAKSPTKPSAPASPQKRTIEGGVIVEELRVGNGNIAKAGKVVQVYYEGRLKNNNRMFDSATKGNGFKFRLGKQEVIKGWDVGVAGMKVGGKRRITCPPHMAYGQKGSPPTIPGNSTLVFEVELKNVN